MEVCTGLLRISETDQFSPSSEEGNVSLAAGAERALNNSLWRYIMSRRPRGDTLSGKVRFTYSTISEILGKHLLPSLYTRIMTYVMIENHAKE